MKRFAGPATAPRWRADLAVRMLRLLPLKLAGISAFIWIFFVAYFHLLRFPPYPVTLMPLLGLDRWIPFQPGAVLAYLSLWVYVGVAPGLLLRLRELLLYGCWIGALCVAGLACFYFWPTAVPRLVLPISDFPGFATLQGVDAAGNACPSMHVAVAVFSALWIDRLLRTTGSPLLLRLVSAAWCVAILWSTLAVKQHVVLDVLAGVLLGSAFAGSSLRWLTISARRTSRYDRLSPGRRSALPAPQMESRLPGDRS